MRRSIQFYERIGFRHTFSDSPENPKYAGVARDGAELHLQWHDAAEWDFPNDRPTYRFVVDDVAQLKAAFEAAGVQTTDLWNTPWGTQEFHLRDPDRNGLQFYRNL